MEQAIIVSETKAILLGERVMDTDMEALDYQVRQHRRRGEIQGYVVAIRSKRGWNNLSEDDVARLETQGGL